MSRSSSAARRQAKAPPLSDLDLRILSLLSRHRVLTQTQLAAITPETPARTLRYRCARLARHGLAGRSRPYRERGSAPHHLWPTRRGEAIACGSPPPRGGERREPNPLFLAHAAALSQVYVALETSLAGGARLARFDREAEAREAFSPPASRRERAIVPDALIEIADAEGQALLAFLELDMGTMSHRRLKGKAALYAQYAEAEAWRERHRFCPALLFLTTTEKRARSFLAAMERELGADALLLTCACELAGCPERCATEPRWLLGVDQGAQPVDLLDALREARLPYDEERECRAAERREEEAKRARLRTDPEALRAHLHSWRGRWEIGSPPEALRTAIEFAVEGESELEKPERRALLALGALFDDPLRLQAAGREPSAEERPAFEELAAHYRAGQLRRVDDLGQRHGEGPALREARGRIEAGGLLGAADLSRLDRRAEDDRRSRDQQERLAFAYFSWREEEARRLAKAQGLAARLRKGPEDFVDEIERRSLRICRRCGEIAYPDPEEARRERAPRDVALRCHFCGGRALDAIDDEGGSR